MARARKNGDEEDETVRDDDDDSDDDSDDGSDNEEKEPRKPPRGRSFNAKGGRSSREAGRAAFALLAAQKAAAGEPAAEVPNPITRAEAAKRLGVRRGTLAKWQRDGQIEGVSDANGAWWFDPVVVDAMHAEKESDDFTSAQLLDAARGIIKQQFGHHEVMSRNMASLIAQAGERDTAMMGAFLSSMKVLLESQTAWALKSHERAAKLEAELDASREAIEAAMTSQVQREQIVADAEARRQRGDHAMRQLTTYAPMVLSLVAKKLGVPGDAAVDPALKELVTSLKPEQLKALMESGILTQDQLAQFAFLWQQVKDSEAQPAGGEPPHPGPPDAKG